MRLAQEVWNTAGTNGLDHRTRFAQTFDDAEFGYYAERDLLTERVRRDGTRVDVPDRDAAGQTVADLIELCSYLKADLQRRYANFVKCELRRRRSGDVHPCPQCEKALYTPVNTFARTLERLHTISPPQRREPTLAHYLAANYGAGGGRDGQQGDDHELAQTTPLPAGSPQTEAAG